MKQALKKFFEKLEDFFFSDAQELRKERKRCREEIKRLQNKIDLYKIEDLFVAAFLLNLIPETDITLLASNGYSHLLIKAYLATLNGTAS